MGLGHAPEGTWIVFVELALMIAVVTMAVRLALRTLAPDAGRPVPNSGGRLGATVANAAKRMGSALRTTAARARPSRSRSPGGDEHGARLTARWGAQLRVGLSRIPRAAAICGAIAVANAACWSLITPPFQVPDEPSHFAYVQLLYENHTLPQSEYTNWSEEETVALKELHHQQVRFHPEVQAISTNSEQHMLAEELARPLGRSGSGGAGVAHSEPPLYYALQTIPYFASSSGSILDQLELMRLFSALFAGLTALFVFMFVREALPRLPWAWTVGGLTIAAAPLLGFMSGAVNPDSMFYAVSAAGFFALARGFRRGLTRPLAACIGAIIAIGLLTKLNFIGETPGMIIGLLVLGLRQLRTEWREALVSAALGFGIAILPGVLYLLDNLVRGRAVLGSAVQLQSPTGGHGSLLDELGYIWQFYLPKLPGTATDFPGLAPWHALWFDRWVGLYGWLDTMFPLWLEKAAFVVAIGLIALAACAVLGALPLTRSDRWRRLSELAVYALVSVGLLVMIGAASYLEVPAQAGRYAEPRYMMPLIALAGVCAALSARGAGQLGAWIGARGIRGASSRWGPIAGALIVVLVLAWDIFSQLQTVARFYG
jgi:energy-converting hydrogenase Eha subunit C